MVPSPISRFRLSFPTLIVLFILAGTAIRAVVNRWSDTVPADATRVIFLDVGQGDATLVDGPGDAEILIDGGPTDDLIGKVSRALGSHDRSINIVVLTHPDADHLVGLLGVLEQYEVDRVLMTGVVHTTREYERFLEIIRDRQIPASLAISGQRYDVGPSRLDILSPAAELAGQRVENLNATSIVARLTIMPPGCAGAGSDDVRATSPDHPACARRFLLTGDAEADIESQLLEQHIDLRADVLKVSHHGSQDATFEAFLDVVRPLHAVVSVGAHNHYHHPHIRTLKRLERAGARIWRTDRQGDVAMTVGRDGLSVTSER